MDVRTALRVIGRRKAQGTDPEIMLGGPLGLDLSGVDLSRLNFAGAVFRGVNFAGVNASNANSGGAIFNGCSFTLAHLVSTNFSEASFNGCDLAHASAYRSNFNGGKADSATRWPYAFNPEVEGIEIDDPF